MTLFEEKVKRYVPRLQTDLGITRIQACGIFGNIGTETGGFKHLQEIKPVVAGSKGGYGWMQWTGPRRRKYEAWCKTNNRNPADDESNYLYLVKETKTDELHSLNQLRKTTAIESATETFMAQNLRPGVKHLDNRIEWAKKADEASKVPVAEPAVVGGTVIAGTAAATQTADPIHWIWIAIGTIAAVIIGITIVKWYKEENKTPEPAVIIKARKKGKKNG